MKLSLAVAKWNTVPLKRANLVQQKALPDGTSPYKVLGVERDATRAEIRAAYVEKMKEIHPDVNSEDTTAWASSVNLAYELLCAQAATSSLANGACTCD